MNHDVLESVFAQISAEFDSVAWAADSTLLCARSLDGLESGLLPSAIAIAAQYFPLRLGDSILVKEVSGGGPGRGRLALISGVQEKSESRPGIWLATAFAAPEARGLRLPPVPIHVNGEWNKPLVDALGPTQSLVEREWESHQRAAARLLASGADLGKKALAEFASESRDRLKQRLAELPEGEVSWELRTGAEIIRVTLQADGRQLRFDFTGTSAGKQFFLPLAATSGLVRATVREWLRWSPFLDTACTELMPISVPNGCFLNAQGKDVGDNRLEEAAAWLKSAVEGALHKWDRRQPRGLTNYFDLCASFRFDGAPAWDLRLPSGSPALDAAEGISFWSQRPHTPAFSVEGLEAKWPVRVLRLSERPAPAGPKPKAAGGRGLLLQLEVQNSGSLFWEGVNTATVRTDRTQTPFEAASVTLARAGSETMLAPGSATTLARGDVLTLASGSGGGLAAAPA